MRSVFGRRTLRVGCVVGATGVAGRGIESKTEPVATELAQTLGVDPGFGPALLLVGALLVVAVAFVVPGLFDDAR